MTALVFAAPDSNNPRERLNSREGVWAVNVDTPVGIQPLALNFTPAGLTCTVERQRVAGVQLLKTCHPPCNPAPGWSCIASRHYSGIPPQCHREAYCRDRVRGRANL